MTLRDALEDAEAPPGTWSDVEPLPPSAKLVATVLDREPWSTQSALAEETMLPRRTVRFALSRLEEAGVVESRRSIQDARYRVYSMNVVENDPEDADAEGEEVAEPAEISADGGEQSGNCSCTADCA